MSRKSASINDVNQKAKLIVLKDYMDSGEGWGHEEGHEVFLKLSKHFKNDPSEIFNVSLKGIERTDVSFPRESVVSIAKHFKKQKWFCLSDLASISLMDNWDAAAEKLGIPLIAWDKDDYKILGLQPPKGTLPILEYILKVPMATTGEVVKAVKLNLPNVSNKLKKLYEDGFLMRKQQVAESGGLEFGYFRIK